MKHSEIVKAYEAISRLGKTEIPLAVSYQLFKIKKLLQPQWDFQHERIETILKKYEPKVMFDGSRKFNTQADGEQCVDELNKAIAEMGEMDVEIADYQKPVIKLDTDIKLSIDDIEALGSFVKFEE